MKQSYRLVGAGLSVALLSACGGVDNRFSSLTPASGASRIAAQRTSAGYEVLHSFGGGTDGQNPQANLMAFKDSLYGTTFSGGAHGYGVIFKVSTTGAERVLHSFDSNDGAGPAANLTVLNGTLYGTTINGGTNGDGTVFTATSAGKERVLYNFRSLKNGLDPSGLTALNGMLWGTTYYGGSGCGGGGCGTAFTVTTAGRQRRVHNFGLNFGHKHAPYYPTGNLTLLNDTFYGMAQFGGQSDRGAVFVLSAEGKVHVLYSLTGADGSLPMAGVTALNGTLYGTTFEGGTGSGCPGTGGCGTVFGITTSGQEELVYSFNYSAGDGAFPLASLTVLHGTLYGTTSAGGAGCSGSFGCGTVFSISPSGQETILHSFTGGSDGAGPAAGLTVLHGTIYGTTSSGGAHNEGTVFALTP